MKRSAAEAEPADQDQGEDGWKRRARASGPKLLYEDLAEHLTKMQDYETDPDLSGEALVSDLTARTLETVNLLSKLKVWLKLSLPSLHEGDFTSSLIQDLFQQVEGAEQVGRLLMSSVHANFAIKRAEVLRANKKGKMGTEASFAAALKADDAMVRTLLHKWRMDLCSMSVLLADLIHKNLQPSPDGSADLSHHNRKKKGGASPRMARRGKSTARIQSRNYSL